jgi:hypothetical protein
MPFLIVEGMVPEASNFIRRRVHFRNASADACAFAEAAESRLA